MIPVLAIWLIVFLAGVALFYDYVVRHPVYMICWIALWPLALIWHVGLLMVALVKGRKL